MRPNPCCVWRTLLFVTLECKTSHLDPHPVLSPTLHHPYKKKKRFIICALLWLPNNPYRHHFSRHLGLSHFLFRSNVQQNDWKSINCNIWRSYNANLQDFLKKIDRIFVVSFYTYSSEKHGSTNRSSCEQRNGEFPRDSSWWNTTECHPLNTDILNNQRIIPK